MLHATETGISSGHLGFGLCAPLLYLLLHYQKSWQLLQSLIVSASNIVFFFHFKLADLTIIDETLFCSHSSPEDNDLPLFLGHFQFTDNSGNKVNLIYCMMQLLQCV